MFWRICLKIFIIRIFLCFKSNKSSPYLKFILLINFTFTVSAVDFPALWITKEFKIFNILKFDLLTLSIKSREILEEKKAMKDYGSSDSGATLGDILGVALNAESNKK